jgi:branched-subunit amino acid transport protein AzlD
MVLPSVSAPHFVSVTLSMGILFPILRQMWYIYYSAIKNNKFMKFLGKWMELENIILMK